MHHQGERGYLAKRCESVANRLWHGAAKSTLLYRLQGMDTRMEARFRESRLSRLVRRERNVIQSRRMFHACLRLREQSGVLRVLRVLREILLKCSLHSYGLLLLLFGGLFALGKLLYAMQKPMTELGALLPACFCILLAIPFLTSKRSLEFALRKSRVLGFFFFTFCGFARELNFRDQGEEHLLAALLLALGGAALALFQGFFVPGLICVSVLLVCLFVQLPELLLCAIFLCFPVLVVLPHATACLVLLLSVLNLAWLWKVLCGKRAFLFAWRDFLLLLFALCYFLGGIFGVGGRSGLFQSTVMSFILLSCLPVQSLLSRPRWRARALAALCIGGVVISLLGIWQYFFGNSELQWVDTNRFFDMGRRVTGSFSNPNFFAVYLLLLLPIALAGALSEGATQRARRCFGSVALCIGICLVLTFTRGAWLGAALALLLLLGLLSPKSCGMLLILPVGFLSCLPWLPQRILRRLRSIGGRPDSSVQYRLYTWQGGMRMLWRHPWGIGGGEAAFVRIYPQYALSGTESVMHAHQLFLQVGISLGISGMVIFSLLLLAGLFALANGCACLRGRARGELLGGFCGIIGVLTMGLFDYVWYHFALCFLFWAVAAMAMATLHERAEEGVL